MTTAAGSAIDSTRNRVRRLSLFFSSCIEGENDVDDIDNDDD